jgi:DNA helicase TIP49 (TBP-interacting protein)
MLSAPCDIITLRIRYEYVVGGGGGMALSKSPMNFRTMAQVDVPQGREGKHKRIVTRILSDLDRLEKGVALKVPLASLNETKENVRSALNRAVHKTRRSVATASDDEFLYVWNAE